MHQGIDDGLAHDLGGDQRSVRALLAALWQMKSHGQVIHHRRRSAVDQPRQGIAHVDGGEALVGVLDPLLAGHADVVDPMGRHQPANGHASPEEQDTGQGRLQLALLPNGGAQGFEQLVIVVAEFLGLSIHGSAVAAIVVEGIRVDIIAGGALWYRTIELDLGALLVQHLEIMLVATIVAVGAASPGGPGQGRLDEIHRLVGRPSLGHLDGHHSLAFHQLGDRLDP